MTTSGIRGRRLLAAGLLAVLTVGAATPASAATGTTAPTGQILRAGGATAVPDSYLVVLREPAAAADRAAVAATADQLGADYGGTVVRVYHAALRGFEVRLPERAAKRLAADPAVAFVEQNHLVPLAAGVQPNPPNWGLDRIDQRQLPLNQRYGYPNTAPNVRAYVIDTGIRPTHIDFTGRVVAGFDAFAGVLPPGDCNGHGTHLAGIIGGELHGVAKDVSLIAVRVLDCTGIGSYAQVIAGIDWTVQNAVRPSVANMGIGGGASTTLDAAVTNAIIRGISFAVPAGSSSANACNYSPSRVPTALTVAGTTITDAKMSSANFGSCLDIFAPGQGITSTWYTGDTATNTISGSSMASAHVAGCVALLLQANPTWSPAQLASYLAAVSTGGVVGAPGAGSPNRLLYCGP
ncbi:S8 family peptidase [Micromonospora sp. NBC_01699]|uniref:S8 family peptidase n=1 Tax=Micromonospora sp. NBC_01699 TaxID=2975984 RepID=UPI002E2F7DAA|nr:S8 family peptidase [Micromonospora sp. NBC_01699]